ncbi:MAG: single-stranded-DNA-specific exonuclease RecJ [Lachnospiraceae bacterium]|nr:single-stranded-DNA-specific exonuclease RecJ [Lachnospiraceae bacterium]
MAQWYVMNKRADFAQIAQTYGISQILARLIRNRDCESAEEIRKYLHGSLEDLYDPMLLLDMDRAVEGLNAALREQKKIRIIGDYDADGICSSYILLRGIQSLGGEVDVDIPHRITDGYGLNERLIRQAGEDGVELIITCDNGIAASAEVDLASSLGMQVIVTDHHEVPIIEEDGERKERLPKVVAVVDPKRAGDPYPFDGICGAVVAWKFMQAAGIPQALLEELIEEAGFATICDVMELKDENRILVKEALRRLAHTQNLGMKALMEVSGIRGEELGSYHIGFVLGPSLNATGRLETAKIAIELLTCTDRMRAVQLATELKNLNDSRKTMTEYGVNVAKAQLEGAPIPKVLVLLLEDVHESIAGIIAGRIKEAYHHPTIVLTRCEGGLLKGSARSIEGYDMFAEMSACKDLYTKFGGHKMAAGVTLPEENLENLRNFLNAHCTLEDADFTETVHVDMALPFAFAGRDLIDELSLLEPFGNGNTKPVFAAKDLEVCSHRIFGKNSNVMKLKVKDAEHRPAELIYFGDVQKLEQELTAAEQELTAAEQGGAMQGGVRMTVAYYPSLNEYRGVVEIQYVMSHYRLEEIRG